MRSVGVGLVACLVVAFMAGCTSAPKKVSSDRGPFMQMQEKATSITDNGGLAAVGVGRSKDLNIAIDMAKTRGRVELANIMEAKVDSLKKDFQEQVGPAESAEVNTLFTQVSKTVAHQFLRGVVPQDIKYEVKGDVTEAFALMVMNPKVIADAFAAQQNTQRNMYTRFRASQAFQELEEETKKFEEFKAKEAGAMMGAQ